MSDIDYTELRRKIDQVTPDELAALLKEAGFVRVAVDPELHTREPESGRQRIVWEALDTAWNLLREASARIAILHLREHLVERGFTGMPTDEEMFEGARKEGEGATSYLDLAPQMGDGVMAQDAADGLYSVLDLLTLTALGQAQEGLAAWLDGGE